MVHEAIIPAMILGIAVVLVGVFAAGGFDMELIPILSNTLQLMPGKQIQDNYHNSFHI